MDTLYCTHCGYKDDDVKFDNVCPKCSCKVLINLNKVNYCGDCVFISFDRDIKTNLYTATFKCSKKNIPTSSHRFADSCFRDKRDIFWLGIL